MSSSAGADYSARNVYLAVTEGEKVTLNKTIDINLLDIKPFIENLFSVMNEISFISGEIYLERPWINKKFGTYTAIQLATTAAYITAAAYKSDITPIFVAPQTWRKAVYGEGRPEDRKELARKLARERFRFETKFKYEHNICEAICLAYYGQLMKGSHEISNSSIDFKRLRVSSSINDDRSDS